MASIDIQSVDRVGKVLSLFGPHREAVSSSEAAELIGLNRTTTYRYLSSLVAAGILELRPDRLYGPGPTLMQLGAYALGRRRILEIAPTPMAVLARTTRITAVLSQWGTGGPVVAHVEEPPEREVVVTVRVGMHLSEQAAQSQVFHAFRGDDRRVAAAVRALPAELREGLDDRLALIREQGYAGQISPRGIAVIAAPVRDTTGTVGSLALLSTRDVLDISPASEPLEHLLQTATALSVALGGTA